MLRSTYTMDIRIFEHHAHQPVPCHFPPHLLTNDTVAHPPRSSLCSTDCVPRPIMSTSAHPPHAVVAINLVPPPGDIYVDVTPETLRLAA